jgi:hypothetical protein
MKVLNEDFDFDQLPPDKRAEVLNAFRGIPQREMFVVGAQFYRFVTPKKGDRAPLLGNAVLNAEWWFGQRTRSQLSQLAYQQRTSLANSARSRLAVSRVFNREMEFLVRTIATSPIYG